MVAYFTNRTFYANPDAQGIRKPVSLKFETPVVLPPDPTDPVDPTDPTVPVDPGIGDPTNGGATPSLNPPVLSRGLHTKDVFIQPGQTLYLTYKADQVCTLVPKLAFEDARIKHTADGKSVTIEWDVPVDEPARSLHIGIKAEIYGGLNVSSNNIMLIDRLHIGKNPADIIWCGFGQSVTQIMTALSTLASGKTLIIANGTYTGLMNRIFIGLKDGIMHNPNTGNGIFTRETYVDRFNGVAYTSTRVKVSKFTSILAEDPFKVILDGQHRNEMGWINGNYGIDRDASPVWVTRQPRAGRTAVGIEVTGVVMLDSPYGSSILDGTEMCSFFNYGIAQRTTFPDFPGWLGAGGPILAHRQNHQSKFERYYCIGNSRMMHNTGQRKGGQPVSDAQANGGIRHLLNAYEGTFNKALFTPACVQHDYNDDISYGVESYGGFKIKLYNMLSLDNVFYNEGITKPNDPGNVSEYRTFSTYGSVNEEGELHDWWGIGQANSGRSFFIIDGSAVDTKIPDTLDNFVCWKFISTNAGTEGPMMAPKRAVSIGRGLVGYTNGYSPNETKSKFDFTFLNTYFLEQQFGDTTINGTLFVSEAWNFDIKSRDTLVYSVPNFLKVGAIGFIDKPPRTYPEFTSKASANLEYPSNEAIQRGAHYITRVEKNSDFAKARLGCAYYFATKGRYLKYYNEAGSEVVYNVNWLSRSLWEEYQLLSRMYVIQSNGKTFNGNQGWAVEGVHPVDYMNRYGTTPQHPENTPYIDDIFATSSNGKITILWRPVCPAYRANNTGYDVYIDGVKVLSDIDKTATKVTIDGVATGNRTVNIVVKDSVTGDSGLSKDVTLYHDANPAVIENPDPGGTGGGSDMGGDIGTVGGVGVIVSGIAPAITRKSHAQDIFVQSGETMTVTYVASKDCCLLPKCGYPDFTVSYSNDAKEMTITWVCQAGEPGDSTYVGAVAWIYGDTDATEAYSELYDRLHVNKNQLDVVRAGKGQTIEIIQDACLQLLRRGGITLILTDGFYNDNRDIFAAGWSDYLQNANLEISNGLSIAKSGTSYNGNAFTDQQIEKNTVIMAETPLGVKLTRNGRPGGITMFGDLDHAGTAAGAATGYRSVCGIKVKGFAVRNAAGVGAYQQRTLRTSIDYCSVTQDLSFASGVPATPSWTGDGSCIGFRDSAFAGYEMCDVIGNERMLCFTGYGPGAFKTTWRNILATNGCTQMKTESISQTFTNYGAKDTAHYNCYAIDSAHFAPGAAQANGLKMALNHTFSQTNGANEKVLIDSCMALNDVRAAVESNSSGGVAGHRDILKNCVFWGRVGNIANSDDAFLLKGQPLELDGVTIGRNPYYDRLYTQTSVGSFNGLVKNLLILSPTWNMLDDTTNVEQILTGSYVNTDGKITLINSYQLQAAKIAGADYFYATRDRMQALGRKYINRNEENTAMSERAAGAENIFIQVGRYGKYKSEAGGDTRYDGVNAPYVNAMSRMPWERLRAERQRYYCYSNGKYYTGKVGWAVDGCNPIDYSLRWGTSPEQPLNCPYLEDIWSKAIGNNSVILRWRPIAPVYRSTITGFHIYIDGIKVTQDVAPIAKNAFGVTLTGINAGIRRINVVVIDPVNGNSGFSRTQKITVS